MNVIIFVRISTADQSLLRQEEELIQFATTQEWKIVKIIREVGSGSTSIEKRKAINDLKQSVIEHNVQKVLVSEMSRIGRTIAESMGVVDYLTNNKISCFEYQRKIETLNPDLSVNPIAELILSVLISVARVEKVQLVTRIKSGMASAARKGKHLGRMKGSIKSPEQFLSENKHIVKSLQTEKLSARKTARLYGVSVGTVIKAKQLCDAR